MNSITKLLMAMSLLLSVTFASAQIKNKTTEKVKVNGNCSMCKKVIETAANVNKEAKVIWNEDTKIATVTYDAQKTNLDVILKRIADAGYDNEKFKAPNTVYDELHGCCQYDREPSDKKQSTSSSHH
ncbi:MULTISPECIES: heavy-metal-associated domain-containing protein [Flavobacterium]|uniref:Copper chaperone n=1 Tax=Flavobacterium lipolyticum TaxID=2893754 RepID=A0ABS8LV34_9FLAO|nr:MULTISPECIES: copper chaperone [unclassified Flavobacterium]MCC9016428.1 copper chaperone [Flavobacterium sp. F-126]